MKFDACPVEPPGLGSGPLSIWTMSVQPSSARWWTRLLPTMPAPMTTQRADEGTWATGSLRNQCERLLLKMQPRASYETRMSVRRPRARRRPWGDAGPGFGAESAGRDALEPGVDLVGL